MPTWRTLDDETAAELRKHFAEDHLVTTTASRTFESGSAVVLAPTSHNGEVMLITARRRSTPVFDQVPELPLEASEPFVTTIPETLIEEPAETYFGPTTWERIEEQQTSFEEESPETSAEQQTPIAADRVYPTEPALPRWEELPPPQRSIEPSYLDYRPEPEAFQSVAEDNQAAEPQPPLASTPETSATPPQRERHYIASGFLGLEESVEDDDDIAREKRPWWKKIFSD